MLPIYLNKNVKQMATLLNKGANTKPSANLKILLQKLIYILKFLNIFLNKWQPLAKNIFSMASFIKPL